MKRRLSTILLILVLLAGLGLLLYPTFSDWWNSWHQSRAVVGYAEAVAEIDNTLYENMLAEAHTYNEALAQRGFQLTMTEEERTVYENTLAVTGSGIMSYIEISKINVLLPIYHGTSESVLQTAVGHLEGSSLPVGGESTHTVISGHRGLPSARLFTDLDKMVVGDTFLIRTLDEVLTYEVDQILIVEPSDVSALAIEKGKDYCTLVTCTPYGINTHRMLVRGHRIDTVVEHNVRVSADAIQVEPALVAVFIGAGFVILAILILLLVPKKKEIKKR